MMLILLIFVISNSKIVCFLRFVSKYNKAQKSRLEKSICTFYSNYYAPKSTLIVTFLYRNVMLFFKFGWPCMARNLLDLI